MTTIKLKNGSGAPLAGNLVQGEPALDLTNKRLYTENSSGTVIEVGTNPTSLTTGGLTVDGLTQLNTNNLSNGLTISGNDNANVKVRFDNTGTSGGDFVIQGGIAGASNQGLSIRDLDNSAQRIHISSGGDISFYEDTGTTAKFFWDASAESLGIGTSSPSAPIDLGSSTGQKLLVYANSNIKYGMSIETSEYRMFAEDQADLTFGHMARSDGSTYSERMRIDASGNVGIGNSSPLGRLTISNAAGTNAPTTVTAANTYLQLGSDDYGPSNNGKFMIGFGFTDATNTNSPAYIGYEEVSTSGDTYGDLTFYTRSVTTDTAPTERMRIDASGNVLIGSIGTGSGTATPVELNLGSTFANSVGSLSKAKLKIFEDSNANVYGLSVSSGLFEYGAPSSAAHAFFVNESEKMRILSSGGITFNGDTAAANALDDYEEGTWTPTVTGATGTTVDVAEYTKIGRLVTIDLRVRWTGSPNDTTPLSFSLPFASQNATAASRTGLVFYNGTQLYGGAAISSHISQGTSNVTFYRTDGGTFTTVLANQINSSYDWLITVSYFT